VLGDRGRSWVGQPRSIYSRLRSLLALGLMAGIGAGLLAWYYTHAALRSSPSRDTRRNAGGAPSQAEMPLPPLTRPAALLPAAATVLPAAASVPVLTGGGSVAGMSELPVAAAAGEARTVASSAGAVRIAPSRSGIERRLSGPVYAPAMTQTMTQTMTPAVTQGMTPPMSGALDANPGVAAPLALAADRAPDRPADPPASSLGVLLRAAPEPAVQATVLATRRLLLPKGAFIDCTLETAIDSTLPGMTTCVTATDTFGVDGKVVLLERGTKLVGETRGQVQQGSARVFVIWTQARTPAGVMVPLDSPGTDELGRSGLAGAVDRHFWDRFGAAILISTIDGAVQAAVESGAHDGGTTIVNPSSVQEVSTETLKSTLNIPPTVIKHNGDRIQILVARDIDFSGVYELRALADAR
jgi:type IV secretion system protein VirB10